MKVEVLEGTLWESQLSDPRLYTQYEDSPTECLKGVDPARMTGAPPFFVQGGNTHEREPHR